MHRFAVIAPALLLAGLLTLNPTASALEGVEVPPEHHAWARFQPGAWSVARIIIENVEEGRVTSTSVTEQKTTLVKVEAESVTLRIESTVEVGGKKLEAPPQTVRQLFLGETIGPMASVELTSAGAGTVTIEGKPHACEVLQLEIEDPAGKTTVKTYYSDQVAPYVLRSESKTFTAGEGAENEEKPTHQTTSEVLSLEMPFTLPGGELKSTSVIQEVTTKPMGSERVLLRRTTEVPGGVVCRSSKELDNEGRIIRRSTLELIAFGTEP